jgi:MFS family permease
VFVAVPVWVGAVGWTVAGMGMGAAFSSISVLLFELSPRSEQGANSAAVQLSDGLGCVAAIGLGGVAYAALRPYRGRHTAVRVGVRDHDCDRAAGVLVAGRIRTAR